MTATTTRTSQIALSPSGVGGSTLASTQVQKTGANGFLSAFVPSYALTELNFQDRTLSARDLRKMPSATEAKFQQAFKNAVVARTFKELRKANLLPDNQPYSINFSLSEEGGLFASVIGANGTAIPGASNVKIADYKTVLQDSKDLLLRSATEVVTYAGFAGIGRKIEDVTARQESLRVSTVANVAFRKVVQNRKREIDELKNNSFFVRNKERFCCIADLSGSAAFLSGGLPQIVPNVPGCLSVKGAFLTAKGVNNFILNCAKFKDISKFGFQKYNKVDIVYTTIGLLNSILTMISGILLIGGSLLDQFTKYNGTILMNCYKWSYNYFIACGFATIVATFQILMYSFRAYRSISFRKEINSFLENKQLSEKEKCLGYLKKIKEKITLTSEEEKKIEEKVIADFKAVYRKRIKTEYPAGIFSDEEIDAGVNNDPELKKAIAAAKAIKIREKIEELQKLLSSELTNELLGIPTHGANNKTNIDRLIFCLQYENSISAIQILHCAKGLVKKIDKASYQTLWTHYLNITLAVLSLTISILTILVELSIITVNPWVFIIILTFIAAASFALDYGKTNNLITGFIYNYVMASFPYDQGFQYKSRKKKVLDLLPEGLPQPQVIPPRGAQHPGNGNAGGHHQPRRLLIHPPETLAEALRRKGQEIRGGGGDVEESTAAV